MHYPFNFVENFEQTVMLDTWILFNLFYSV